MFSVKPPRSIWLQLFLMSFAMMFYMAIFIGIIADSSLMSIFYDEDLFIVVLNGFHFIVWIILLLAIFKRRKEAFIFPLIFKILVTIIEGNFSFIIPLILLTLLFYHPDTQAYYDRKIENIEMEEHLVD